MLAVVLAESVPVVALGSVRAVVPLIVVRCGDVRFKDKRIEYDDALECPVGLGARSVQIGVRIANGGSLSVVAGDTAHKYSTGVPLPYGGAVVCPLMFIRVPLRD